MSTRTSVLLLLCSANLMACFPQPPDYTGGGGSAPDASTVDPCARQSAGSGDGFPFDVAVFEGMVQPALMTNNCQLSSGCHAPGNANRFTIFTDGQCPEIQTFNQVFQLSSYQQGGAASRIVQAIDGTLAAHPIKPPGTDALVTLLTDYIDTAKTTYEGGGGGGGEPFDAATFASQIQPLLDSKNCIEFCHNVSSSSPSGDFGMTPEAAAGSAEIDANRDAVIERIDTRLSAAEATMAELYVRATDTHSGNPITDAGDLDKLRSWIASGLGQ